MIPVLYHENETQFQTNGIGRLSDAISCVVTEERNGIYELSMQYPMTGKYFSELQEDRIIFAKPSESATNQPFRIYKISRPLNGIVTVDAEHISYLLNKIVCMPFTAGSCAEAFTKIPLNAVPSCPFTFWTDKSVASTFRMSEPRAIRGMLGGEQGSILDTYGKGDYEFDKFAVYLRVNRGADNGVVLRYGKNITELNRTTDMSTVYTGIVPFWKNETQTVTLPEQFLMSSHASDFAYQIVKPVDFSGTWQEAPTVAQLRTRAQKYLTDNEGWLLNDHIKVSFVALFDTEEYKDYASLQRVSLCDTVTIIYTALGVNAKAKVIRTVYDTLLERYNEIELGSAPNSLGKAIQEQILDEVPTTSEMQTAIANGTRLITGNNGGYVVLKTNANGKPKEILVMDTEDVDTATKVWRFNNSGLGYSSTGYNGTYKQAWTIDGGFYTDWVTTGLMTANIIKAGILSDAAGKNSWNMVTGVFELNAAAKVGDTGYTLTQIKANAEGLQTKVEANGVISAINQTAETIKIQASKVNLTGYVTMTNLSTSGQTTINGANITTGIIADANSNTTFNLSDGTLTMKKGSIKLGSNFSVLSDGTMTAKAGTIGGWTIGGDILRKYTGTSGSVYRMLLYAPTNVTANATQAIQIAQGTLSGNTFTENSGGGYRRPFYVRYDGYLNAVGGGRIGTWTLGAGADGALYHTRNALYTNKNGVYLGYDGIAVGGSTKTGSNYAYFEANTADSIVYINQLMFRNEDGTTSQFGFNVDGSDTSRIYTGGAIDVNRYGTGTTYLRGKNEINGYQKSSDRRIKSNIKTITAKNAKKFIMALRPVSHTYKKKYKGYYLEGIHHALIAQEAREAIVDGWALVSESDEGILGIRYDEIVADVIALMQEQEKRIEKLEEKLNGHTDRSH